jgi:lipoate-protein ligase B
MRKCGWRQLGRIGYGEAVELQQALVERRKEGAITDQLLLLEHPHVITLGRTATWRTCWRRAKCWSAPASRFIPRIAAAT